MNVYERIKMIRKDKGLSQTAFGDKLGASRDMISNIELGRVEPNGVIINLICSTFNVNKEWLITGDGEIYTISKEDNDLSEAIAKISLSDNETLKRIVTRLEMLEDKLLDSIDVIIDRLIQK